MKIGMTTGAGLTAEKTAAAVTAGIDVYHKGVMTNRRNKPVTFAFLPEDTLPPLAQTVTAKPELSSRKQRMLSLLSKPLQACSKEIPASDRISLFLALPEPLEIIDDTFDKAFLQKVAEQTGLCINTETSQIFAYGRSGGLLALNAGMLLLDKQPAEHIIVGGVDTYKDIHHLLKLDAEDRLLAEAVTDSFVPGEAAAFIHIKPSMSGSKGNRPKIQLYPPGAGSEPGYRYNPHVPYKGEGLAMAVRQALLQCPAKAITQVYCTMNGESFSNKEWGVAAIRHQDYLADTLVMHHPAEYFGDVGAASAPVLMALAIIALQQQKESQHVLLWCSSELDSRTAMMLTNSYNDNAWNEQTGSSDAV